SDLNFPIVGRNVLVVEDIYDTGLTLKYLLDNLETRKPRDIKICCLLSKPENRRVEIPIDFLGFEIPNRFVVGYGLDFAEKYRNLPYIGVLDR
ncbi:MAG: hypoxanthine phosphoribosyltransferase, partial [Deltaproteobacteria bacterium]